MKYVYTAKNSSGETIIGAEDVPSKSALYERLRSHNLSLISSTEEKVHKSFSIDLPFVGGVSMHEKIVLSRNLSVMLDAGLSLSRAITIVSKQSRNKYLKKVMEAVENSIKSGKTFHESLALYPKVFPGLFVSMVAAGEESGKLSRTLETIGSQMEKSYLLKKKVKGALIYPSIIIFAMVVIAVFMLIFVVPTLTATFSELKVDLPSTTKLIIWASSILQNHFIFFVSGLFSLIGLVYMIFKTRQGKNAFFYLSIKFPLIGTLVREINAARTARTLSSLLTSGVAVVDSLRITTGVIENIYFKKVLQAAEKQIQTGAPMSSVFTESGNVYPIYVGEMMSVGEETGELGSMLAKVAVFFEDEVDQKTKDMSTIIEPFLMLIVGVAVGFFALSMIAPMYSLVNTI